MLAFQLTGFTALMHASQKGHVQVTELFLNKQANVNLQETGGTTALMPYYGHFQVADSLLNKEADVEISNNKGVRALMYGFSKWALSSCRVIAQ